MGILEDGSGNGFSAKVNSDKEVATFSQAIRQADLRALNGKKFITLTGSVNVPNTSGSIYPIFDFLNIGQRKVVLTDFYLSWNKSTPIQINVGATSALATGNNTALAIGNLDSANSAVPSDVSFQRWNESGAGMTYASTPTYGHFYSLAMEKSPWVLSNYNIWGPGSGASVGVKAEEAGVFTLIFDFIMEDL